jgi:hypothetical protein
MAQKSAILFTGFETPKEMAQKLLDVQRQLDNRISAIETKQAELEDRLEELED